LFVLVSLAIWEYFEQSQVFRSMESLVWRPATSEQTNEVTIRRCLLSTVLTLNFAANREDEQDPMGKIVYLVNLKHNHQHQPVERKILSGDRENIE